MMSRIEFIEKLESLLSDIPSDERKEALQYYNNYFDDAGEENEEKVIKELGSPEQVAAIIKADLDGNDTKPESRGYFTENGYQDTILMEDKYEIVNSGSMKDSGDQYAEANPSKNRKENQNEQFAGQHNSGYYYQQVEQQNQDGTNQNSAKQQSGYQHGVYQQSGNQNENDHKQKQYKRNTKIGWIILLCILAIPIGIPAAATAFGFAVAILGTILALFVGFGIAGLTLMGLGTALIIAGIIKLGIPFIGFFLCGIGLLSLGTGMLFVMLTVFIGKTIFPAIIRDIVKICRLPFENRSVMA